MSQPTKVRLPPPRLQMDLGDKPMKITCGQVLFQNKAVVYDGGTSLADGHPGPMERLGGERQMSPKPRARSAARESVGQGSMRSSFPTHPPGRIGSRRPPLPSIVPRVRGQVTITRPGCGSRRDSKGSARGKVQANVKEPSRLGSGGCRAAKLTFQSPKPPREFSPVEVELLAVHRSSDSPREALAESSVLKASGLSESQGSQDISHTAPSESPE